MDRIFRAVMKETGVTKAELKSKTRKQNIVNARMLFVAIARSNSYSFPKIADEVCRDHTTIIYLYQKSLNSKWIKQIIESKKYDIVGDNKIRLILSGRYGYLFNKYKGKCHVCGFDEVVEVHHITPQKMGGTDDENNLILLCPNHHALADRGMLQINDLSTPYPSYPQP